MEAITKAHDGKVQVIDTSVVRVHQQRATAKEDRNHCLGRSRGGLTTKIRALFTPEDKRAENYIAALKLVAVRIWLRDNESTP